MDFGGIGGTICLNMLIHNKSCIKCHEFYSFLVTTFFMAEMDTLWVFFTFIINFGGRGVENWRGIP